MTTTPDDGTGSPGRTWREPVPPSSVMLTLRSAGFGARTLTMAGDRPARRVPFRLGPLEGEAVLDTPPTFASRALDDGSTTTSWQLTLVADQGSEWTPAALFEAFGYEVTR